MKLLKLLIIYLITLLYRNEYNGVAVETLATQIICECLKKKSFEFQYEQLEHVFYLTNCINCNNVNVKKKIILLYHTRTLI